MVITPKVFVLAIATGLFWLAVITFALLLLAGIVRGLPGMLITGLTGLGLCGLAWHLFHRFEKAIARWVSRS